jgi:MurNAc alpha-1-phosphate uridylyltransferase
VNGCGRSPTRRRSRCCAGGKALIVWHLERLAAAGWRDVVINHAHLGEQIEAALGDGHAFGLRSLLAGTARGAGNRRRHRRALPLLGTQPFLVVNGDIWCDWDFARARRLASRSTRGAPTSCWSTTRRITRRRFPPRRVRQRPCAAGTAPETLTYAGIGVFWPEFFAGVPRGSA